jgi:hypothetical protein
MAANKHVISQQNDLDCAAVERSLAILRTAREEIAGWQAITLDPDARAALQDTEDALQDLQSDLHGSTRDMRAAQGEVA